jgi:protein-disulfide isomerase
MLDSLLPFIECRIKLCLGYFDFEVNMMESKGSGGCCKLGTVLSVVALLTALAAYFFPRKEGAPGLDATFDERVKRVVLDTVKQNPQLLMDAMGEGIAKKREDAVKQLGNSVLAQKDALVKQGLSLGKNDSKKLLICFFDPLCKHCIEFQKSAAQLVRGSTDVSIVLIPVGVLGEDSVTLAKVYIAVYEKSPEKALSFIEAITAHGEALDKDAIEQALKKVNLTYKEIESLLPEADKKLASNGVVAEKLGIPVVPAIFYIFESKVRMLQTTSAEQIINELNAGADSAATATEQPDGRAPMEGDTVEPSGPGAEKEGKN